MNPRIDRRTALPAGISAVGAAGMPQAAQAFHEGHSHRPLCGAGPLAQDFTVVLHQPNRQLYVEGCGITRLDDGALLATVPVVPRGDYTQELRVAHSHLNFLRSDDHGVTWQPVSRLPYYSGRLWLHKGALYLFAFEPGPSKRNDDVLLLRSEDAGRTWSNPTRLFDGHFWNCHTSLVERDGRVYWTFDDISGGTGRQRAPCVVAGDLSADLMRPKAWRLARGPSLPPVPELITNAEIEQHGGQYLEPNIIDVNGRLRVLSVVKIHNQTTTNLTAVFDVTDDGGELKLDFVQFHPMPGAQLKFCIVRDDVSKMFWATANFCVDGQGAFGWWKAGTEAGVYRGGSSGGNDRRFMMLLYGLDGLNWFQAGCVAQAAKVSQSFMYGALAIDGDDLAIISRTSINAPNQHDADHATFHRVRDFRRLALNLVPDAI